MANYRVQVVTQLLAADVPRDWIANVLTYRSGSTPASNLGDGVLAAFTGAGAPYNVANKVTVKVYDLANPLHSPPVYTTNHAGGAVTYGIPRQVALCLSWYATLNIKGMRGRIYVAPAFLTGTVGEYATTAQMSQLTALGGLLKNPGGPDIVHTVRHKVSGTMSDVTNYFVNNRWDTMRSRLPKETARQVST